MLIDRLSVTWQQTRAVLSIHIRSQASQTLWRAAMRLYGECPCAPLVAAVAGGLMLGYGARLAYGCNIEAYFSGIVSGSLHGWLWLIAAFAGNVVGTRLRPLFGLEVERIRQTGC